MRPTLDDAEFWKRAGQALETGMKIKKAMLRRGLLRCRCKCPRCGQMIHASLAGPKKHLHMACEGRCGMNVME